MFKKWRLNVKDIGIAAEQPATGGTDNTTAGSGDGASGGTPIKLYGNTMQWNMTTTTSTDSTSRAIVLDDREGLPPLITLEKQKTEIKQVIIPEQEHLSWKKQKGKLLAVIHKDDVEELDGVRLYKGPVTTRASGGLINTNWAWGTSSGPPFSTRALGRTVSRGMALLKEFVIGNATLKGKDFGQTEKWLDAEGQIYHRRLQTAARNPATGEPLEPLAGGEVMVIENDDNLFFSSKAMTELAEDHYVLEVETPVKEEEFYDVYGEEEVRYVDPVIEVLRKPWKQEAEE